MEFPLASRPKKMKIEGGYSFWPSKTKFTDEMSRNFRSPAMTIVYQANLSSGQGRLHLTLNKIING
jgi:hypothetical protein